MIDNRRYEQVRRRAQDVANQTGEPQHIYNTGMHGRPYWVFRDRPPLAAERAYTVHPDPLYSPQIEPAP